MNVLALIKRVKWNQWVLNSAQYGFYAFIEGSKIPRPSQNINPTPRGGDYISRLSLNAYEFLYTYNIIVNIYEEILIVLSWYASVTSHIFPRVAEIRGNKQGQGTMKIKKWPK